MTLREKTLGELALSVNGASALFRRYDLDFCCGGKRTLATAAEKKSLNIDEIEQALLALKDEAPADGPVLPRSPVPVCHSAIAAAHC